MKQILTIIGCVWLTVSFSLAQQKSLTPDVTQVVSGKGWKLSGRAATVTTEDGKNALRFDEKKGQGFAWLVGSDFSEGTIDIDLKGKNELQRSFVGVAFRGTDDTTHDAVYFRPFNFKSADPVRRIHAVQYVSHPTFTWEKLRTERNGQYEKAVNPVPDPDGWFHARIVLANRKVSVYVNDAKEPSLVVEELSERKGGMVGLWVGEGSGGAFANLKITPSK